jgi:hypothetical protein
MIEQLLEILMWVLAPASGPFLLGNMGGQPAQAPTLDTGKSKELTKAELEIKRKEIGPTTAAAGTASRDQFSRNLEFALRGFTNPASVVYGGQIADTNKRLDRLRGELKDLQGVRQSSNRYGKTYRVAGKWLGQSDYNKKVSELEGRIGKTEGRIKNLKGKDPVAELQKAFRPEFAARDRLLGDMQGARKSTAEYTRMQDAYGKGLEAQQTGAGALGNRLMQEAMAKMDQGGQLSPEAARDATQAARSGMAARGMATGNAGLGAELLNRDRYAREREFQNLGFAQNVQTQDLGRRQVNTAMRDDTNRFNIGLLGTSAQLSDLERGRQLALGQDAYNFRLSTNPKLMLAGLGSPYANMTSNAMQMVSGAQFTPQYSGGQFSGQGGGINWGGAAMGGAGGALSGAATGAVLGSVVPGVGTAVGAVAGGLIGGLGGGAAGGGLSDEREKTDIKPLGTLTSVLKIPAYEYRYKGEKKKRKGVMAQDVQKVLPEAVTEVDYQGKRRLAIKPGVIGAALAEELTNQTKAVAA